eukprot:CAMPEP_0181094328 /NCGR_PEP_ID=MMETSP1071-20121207/9936_1 /TAXON_ID=35127 /ORGANISM="Thalassiosira sp., Strain NH16" /LENGTH=573 /DNA_ID=CAMNT_0023176653 /DNA_START=25 /DNA_END=1746 /DNA_ORIENTATION=+
MDLIMSNTHSYGSTTALAAYTPTADRGQRLRRGGTMYHRPCHVGAIGRHRHPLIIGTAALSLLATALPSSAFAAASTGASAVGSPQRHFAQRPLFARGGASTDRSDIARNTDSDGEEDNTRKHARAPPSPAVSPFSRPVRRVAVVGGTHGNEYTGVWCIKAIERQREIHEAATRQQRTSAANDDDDDDGIVNIFERFPSLEIETLLANPVAYMENKRFVDVDLNREFSAEKLRKVPVFEAADEEECDLRTEFCSDGNVDAGEVLATLPHEAVRAREIDTLLGPKFTEEGGGEDIAPQHDDPATCVVIDLHTTTANMGISLIIPEGDALMSAAAAYVLDKCRRKYGVDGAQCLMHALPKRRDRMNLSSCGRHGFTIEVGPTPQGVIRHDAVEKTEVAMRALLEFLHLRNLELEEHQQQQPKGDDGNDASSSPILDNLNELYPGGIVPCYRSAPAMRPGELSGKISWPADPANPNFPAVMVHKSLQDRDFHPIRAGDPLFVRLDGTVVPYDGSHGEEVHLVFVNEGGYYYASSGTGIGVAVTSRFDFRTGWFVVDSDDEDGAVEEVVVEEKDSYE